ncbi:MAG: hypothetical protein AAF499_18725, partial [Pseudomonadota bacterium]
MQNQCAGLEEAFESLGFLSIFFDISCGFVVLFNDPFAIMFVVLAAFVSIIAMAAAAVRPGSAPKTMPTNAARTTNMIANGSLNKTTNPQEMSK